MAEVSRSGDYRKGNEKAIGWKSLPMEAGKHRAERDWGVGARAGVGQSE